MFFRLVPIAIAPASFDLTSMLPAATVVHGLSPIGFANGHTKQRSKPPMTLHWSGTVCAADVRFSMVTARRTARCPTPNSARSRP